MFTTLRGTAAARNYGYRLANALVAAIVADSKSVFQIAKDAGIRESDLRQFLGNGLTPYANHAATISDEVAASIAFGLTTPSSITIAPFDLAIVLSGGNMSGATVGAAYSDTVSFPNAAGRVTWSIASGAMPGGLSIATATTPVNQGNITGTPTAPTGTYNFTIRGVDSVGVERTIATSIVLA